MMNRFTERMLAIFTLTAAMTVGCGGTEAEDPLDIESVQNPLVVSGAPHYENFNNCVAGGQQMLCCPHGQAMTGYRGPSFVGGIIYKETLKCQPFTVDPNDTGYYLDVGTQREIWQQPLPPMSGGHTWMHVCEFGKVMVGIHASSNRFACRKSKPPTGTAAEYLDLNSQDLHTPPAGTVPPGVKMHTCNGGRGMSGVHLSKNQWSCLTDQAPF